MNKTIRFVIILIAIGLLPGVLLAEAKYDDIRILVDVSGSMKKTDPSNLRIPALKLLNGLIPDGAHAGVWTFGRYVDMTVKWGKVDDAWRKRADIGADQIHSNGLYTNIEKALARATQGWKEKDPDTRRNIILLTDGQVDISKHDEKNQQSRQTILTESIHTLKRLSVKIHAVALSKQTDEILLKRLALETGGSFEVAETAQELQKLFFKMFERATEPNSVKLKGKQFSIDKSIKEMTLLIFRQPGSKPTRLFPPESNAMTARRPGNSKWRSSAGYDLITIKKPVVGVWNFDADIDPDNRLMVITDLKLKLDALPSYLMPLEPFNIGAELFNKDKKIKKNSFLRFVDFGLLHVDPEDNEKELKLAHTKDRNKKGLYGYAFPQGLGEGSHSFVVSADARTFNRSKRVTIEIQWPVVIKIDPADEPGNYLLSIEARQEYLKPESLFPTLRIEAPDGTRQEASMKQSRGGWIATIETTQNGLYQALINIKAENNAGKDIQIDLGRFPMIGVFKEPETMVAKPVAEASETVEENTENTKVDEALGEKDQPDWVFTSILAGLANLGLLLGGLGVWYFLRRKQSDPELVLDDGGANA